MLQSTLPQFTSDPLAFLRREGCPSNSPFHFYSLRFNAHRFVARARLFPLRLFRVDAAWPRLRRSFRTAPVSRQT
jgi:hypothetical protein